MNCYFIAYIRINDWQEYNRYLDGFDEIFEKYRGKVIVVDDYPTVLEGRWTYTRVVVIRFPDKKEARRWYDSSEYQSLVKHRHAGAEANVVLVEGRE